VAQQKRDGGYVEETGILMHKTIPYGSQYVDESDIAEVVEVLKSDFLTTGPKVAEFEKALCNYVGAKHSIAVNSGTSALDIAMGALNFPSGSEVITTPFTFVASSNCILYNNYKPVFADIDKETYNIDPNEVRKKITEKTKAIICVDYAGHPCALDELRELAIDKGLYLIEDACHSLGAEYKGRRIGAQADITAFSFHPVKHITTGEGGAAVTQNEEIAEHLKLLRNHGIDKTPSERSGYSYDMLMLGRNYRITDFQCALGISQLKKMPEFLGRRQRIAILYAKELSGINDITIPIVMPHVKHAWHLYPILIGGGINRDRIFSNMRKYGIGVNVHYIPVYKFSYYKKLGYASEYPNTEEISSRVLSIPMFAKLSDDDALTVVEAIKKSLGK
jgi:UDP-4-amino-4,6-dideoxy-N-acetyl-beta-L-altrosamine transaminase